MAIAAGLIELHFLKHCLGIQQSCELYSIQQSMGFKDGGEKTGKELVFQKSKAVEHASLSVISDSHSPRIVCTWEAPGPHHIATGEQGIRAGDIT